MLRFADESSPMSEQGQLEKRKKESTSPVGLYFKQLGGLLWKSLIVRRVHFISTFFELLGPVILVLIYGSIYSSFAGPRHPNSTGQATNENSYNGPLYYSNPTFDAYTGKTKIYNRNIWYAPKNASILMRSLVAANASLESYASESSLASAIINFNYTVPGGGQRTPPIGIYFENLNLDKAQLKYKFYFPLYSYNLKNFDRLFPHKFGQAPVFDQLYDQQLILKSLAYVGRDFVQQLTSSSIPRIDVIELNRMPYPRYYETGIPDFNMYDFIGSYIVVAYVLICPLIVKRITDEKSTKSKELLRMVGMSDFVFWSAHFVNYLILFVLHSAALTLILFCMPNPIFAFSSGGLFFIVFVLYGIQIILFSMLITTVFNR